MTKKICPIIKTRICSKRLPKKFLSKIPSSSVLNLLTNRLKINNHHSKFIKIIKYLNINKKFLGIDFYLTHKNT